MGREGHAGRRQRREVLRGLGLVVVVLGGLLALPGSSFADATPTVTIAPPSEPGYTSASVAGTVNPNGGPSAIYWRFEWSTEPADPFSWHWSNVGDSFQGAEAEATTPIPVSGRMEGLPAGSVVAIRLNAETAAGAVTTEPPYPIVTTKTVLAPSVSIEPATSITATAAHLAGVVDPNGTDPAFDSNWHFECTPACPGLGGGTAVADGASHQVSADATGLDPHQRYEVRLVASNAGGSATSGPVTFETSAASPGVETLYAGAVGTGGAVLAANVDPRNSAVAYQFEWGPDDSFGHLAPAAPTEVGSVDNAWHFVTAAIEGLQPGQAYAFRVVATNLETGETTVGVTHHFATLSVAPPASGCPNETARARQGARRLPDCRAYELVSPPDKNGSSLTGVLMVNGEGNRVASSSSGSFAHPRSNMFGAPYVSERTSAGWVTANLAPRGGVGLALDGGFLQYGNFSADLTKAVTQTANSEVEPQVRNIFLTSVAGDERWITAPTGPVGPPAPKNLVGSSADLGHIVFESTQEFGGHETLGTRQLWESDGATVRLVSVLPDGSPAVAPQLGSGANALSTESTATVAMFREPDAVSADGSRIFFTAEEAPGPELFARVDGTRTVGVSFSQRAGSVGQPSQGGASFVGASVDGSKVVFSSGDRLTDDATPGGGLYRFDVDSGALEFLTPTVAGAGGIELDGVATVSEDASRVYFVARAQLVPDQGRAGAHNLYVTGGGQVRFIATLADLDYLDWRLGGFATFRTARSTPDGAHMVFESRLPLTGYPSAGHVEVYEWDDQTQTVTCASCGGPGTEAGGDASIAASPIDPETEATYNGLIPVGYQGALSRDGSRVFFETTDSLDPRDVNGKEDVYAFEDGRTYLVSSGTSSRDSEIAGNSASGDDVFFTTNDSLAPQDVDGGAGDIYDARIGGGFPVDDSSSECEGGDCQSAGVSPPFATPGSSTLGAAPKAGRGDRGARRAALRRCRKKPPKARKRCEARVKRKFAKRAFASPKGGR